MAAEDFEFEFTEDMVIEMLRGNDEAEDWYTDGKVAFDN